MLRRPVLVLLVGAAVLAAVYVVLAASGECGASASCPATATVEGRKYTVGVVRNLEVSDADLALHGRISQAATRVYFADDAAYALRDVDPTTLLLVRSAPGLQDDAGPWGPFVGLWSDGQDPDVCRYFVSLGPTWCAAPPGSDG